VTIILNQLQIQQSPKQIYYLQPCCEFDEKSHQ